MLAAARSGACRAFVRKVLLLVYLSYEEKISINRTTRLVVTIQIQIFFKERQTRRRFLHPTIVCKSIGTA